MLHYLSHFQNSISSRTSGWVGLSLPPVYTVGVQHSLASWFTEDLISCRFHWFRVCPRSLIWWGAVAYVIGNVQYQISSTTALVHNFQLGSWSEVVVKWLTTNMYLSGGVFYAVAAVFYVALDTGPCLWKGKPYIPSQTCLKITGSKSIRCLLQSITRSILQSLLG